MTTLGYLERPYLSEAYLAGFVDGVPVGMQVRMIVDKQREASSQVLMQIVDSLAHIMLQVNMVVDATGKSFTQANMVVDKLAQIRSQVEMLRGTETPTGMQVLLGIEAEKATAAQLVLLIEDVAELHAQVQMVAASQKLTGMQTFLQSTTGRIVGLQQKISPLLQTLSGHTYLTAPYLTESYLAYGMHAWQGIQVAMNAYTEHATGAQTNLIIQKDLVPHLQVNMVVFDDLPVGMQTAMRIVDHENKTGAQVAMSILDFLHPSRMQVLLQIADKEGPLGLQLLMVRAVRVNASVTMVIYNTTQLRMMKTFASRGTPALAGTNWTSDPVAATGDFSPNNLNTDVIEQCWRSQDGDVALVSLICDTGLPQGAFVDTVAILGHNLTKSATVTMQGSAFADFSTVGFNAALTAEENNMYYIAPDLPTAGYRYWRFLIEDPTNPDGYLKIGTLIFGAAEIFSVLESFTNPIVQGHKHFKDVVETEGFTNVSNDRALRKYLRLSFEKLLATNGNYAKLEEIFLYARTGLKVLYIPTPEYPSKFAIFGKLTTMPETSHISHGEVEEYVDLSLDIDESL